MKHPQCKFCHEKLPASFTVAHPWCIKIAKKVRLEAVKEIKKEMLGMIKLIK